MAEPIIVKEYAKVEINYSYLDKLQAYLKCQKLESALKVTRHGIKTKSWVGVIKYKNLHLEILPKLISEDANNDKKISEEERSIILKNLIFMLSYTKNLDIKTNDNAKLSTEKNPFIEILIREFATSLFEALKRLTPKRYVREEENLNYLKGKIKFSENIRYNCTNQAKFYCEYDEFSENNLLNQLFLFVSTCLYNISNNSNNKKTLKFIINYYSDISFVRFDKFKVRKIKLTRNQELFKKAFNLAKMFVEQTSVDLSKNKFENITLIWDMNKLFEEFIFELIKRKIPECEAIAQKPKRLLKKENVTRRDTRIDILIQKPQVIIDTKYKKFTDFDDISSADIYQVTTYCLYRYKNHCLLSSITELFKNIPKTLLKEHYRCHPKIIEFCNKKFYNNELIILSDVKSSRMPLVLCYTTEGNHARNHYNQRQIDMIVNEIIPKYNICLDDNSLGIVTPYRNQTDALQKTFKNTTVKADTVDKFQGQENKVIIISTVDNEISDFTDNPNRLNVAISRAIEQLILVINPNEMSKDKNINDLVNYIKYNNLEICDSKLYSVFDYLYKCYEQRKQEILKKHKKISQYDSENLMYIFINKIINKYYPNQFNVTPHVMLKTILKDKSLLTTNRELQYVLNNSTHIDFLIYKNIDKSPFLAIEVDGYKYHSEGTKQAQRDILKNEILKKYGIPLLRFKTNGSNEQEILITTINNINI